MENENKIRPEVLSPASDMERLTSEPLLLDPIFFHIPSDRFISSMKRPFLIMAPSMSVMPISLARV